MPLTKERINLIIRECIKFHRPGDVPHPPSDRANDAILIADPSCGYQFRHWCDDCELYSGDPQAPYPGNIPHSTDEHDQLVKDATRKGPLKGSFCDEALTSVEIFNANYQNELVTKMNNRGRTTRVRFDKVDDLVRAGIRPKPFRPNVMQPNNNGGKL